MGVGFTSSRISFLGTFFTGIAQTAMKVATRIGKTKSDAFDHYEKTGNIQSLEKYKRSANELTMTSGMSAALSPVNEGRVDSQLKGGLAKSFP